MIFMKMSIYKILDSQSRVVLLASLREQTDIHKGDIIELYVSENKIIIEKLDVVKINDSSQKNMQNTVISAAKKLDQGSLLMLARKLVELAEKKEEKND